MIRDGGSAFHSSDRFEAHVRSRLCFPKYFENHRLEYLPRMTATIPGQFNNSGHGVDIMALDQLRRLWIIEVSRGSNFGCGLVKLLGKRADGNSQMSPAWRIQKMDAFMERAPDWAEKLKALFDISGSSDDVRELLGLKLAEHRVAIIVPAGCHVEGSNVAVLFGRDIYTPVHFEEE